MLVGSYNYSLNKITDIIRPLYNDIFNTAKQAYIVATLYDIMQTNEIYNQYTLQIVKYTENPDLAFQITEDTNIFATSLVTFVFADSNNLDIPIYSYIPNGALSNIADTQSLSIHHIMTYYKHNLYKFSNLTERTHVCYFKLKPATN